MTLTRVIEALLFSAQKPLSIPEIATAIKGAEGDPAGAGPNEFSRVREAEVAAALEQLKIDYVEQQRLQPIRNTHSGCVSFFPRRSRRG